MKAFKSDLKKWNEEEFRNVEIKRKQLFNALDELDTIEESSDLNDNENLEKDRIELEPIVLEEISARQKSGVLWLRGIKILKFSKSGKF